MDPWTSLVANLTKLKETWPSPLWTWDSRFCALASSFTREQEPSARTSAMHAFPRGWTIRSLETAPPEMRALAERTGGLRAGQRLLAGDAGLYGLWWPWGNGDTTSLRIGIAELDAKADPFPRLRELFGVT